jgi:hypothetical protein
MKTTVDDLIQAEMRVLRTKLFRAEAIIAMLQIFYPNQVKRASGLADMAMRTPDNTAPNSTHSAA